ncbi:hypothetical protein SRHO_G00218090 [Serrasalmus rhombeus]
MWLFRWDKTLAVSKQPEFDMSQCHQAGDSNSPGAEGTRASCRSRKKAKDHPALCMDDESSGTCLGSALLEQCCREERPAVQDEVRRTEHTEYPYYGTLLVRKGHCEMPIARVNLGNGQVGPSCRASGPAASRRVSGPAISLYGRH